MSACIFCQIINNQIPTTLVHTDQRVIAFEDISPQSPIHLLIIPKQHICSLNEITPDQKQLIGHIAYVALELAKKFNIAKTGYRLVNNCGKQGGQSVDHLHFHLLGGRALNWPPG